MPVHRLGSDVESKHSDWTALARFHAHKRPAVISLAGRGAGRRTRLADHVAAGVRVKTLRSGREHDVPDVQRP